MTGLKYIIGYTGVVIGFCLQLSPLPGMIEGLRKMEVKSMTISYFTTAITQSLFWIGYGLCLHDPIVWFPNVTGIFFFGLYLNLLIYIQNKYRLFFILNTILTLGLIIIIKYLPEHACDTTATVISLVWQTTNLETIKLGLKFKDKAYINLLLSWVSFFAFFCGWSYSLFINAYIMFIPNIYGFCLNIINLIVYYWASGYIGDNVIINFLKSILKPENFDANKSEHYINKELDENFSNSKNDKEKFLSNNEKD